MTKNFFIILALITSFRVQAQITQQTTGSCAKTGTTSTCKWFFDSTSGTLSITGHGLMEDYQRKSEEYTTAPWYQYHNEIKNIIVADGITNISENAFALTAVQNVNLPNSIIKIDKGGFYYCTNLSSIKLPQNLENIGDIAFTYSGLQSVDIPESVSNIGTQAFAIRSLKSINLPDSVNLGYLIFWELGEEHPVQNFQIYCKGKIKVCEEKVRNNALYPFDYSFKIYRKNHRIYTIEEANAVSGDKNRVSITYR